MPPEAILQVTNTNGTSPLTGAIDCKSAKCGMDAGCRREPDGSYICICTHDLSRQRADGSCPRFVVTGPHTPPNKKTFITIRRKADKDHLPGTGYVNSSSFPPTAQILPARESELNQSPTATVVLWVLPLLGVVLVLASLLWLRRRLNSKKTPTDADPQRRRPPHPASSSVKPHTQHQSDVEQQMPVCLTKNVLDTTRFMANPEYDWNGDVGDDAIHLLADQFKAFHLIRPESIELQQEIGEGCFGKVFRGYLHSSDPLDARAEAVAVKVLKTAAGPAAQEELLQEAEIMSAFSHKNILALRGIVVNDMSVGPWLVFEYMALGDLAQLLRSANGNHRYSTKGTKTAHYTLNQDDLHSIAEQIADGMAYLSSQHFVHRDLACRNCLVGERPGNGGLDVKISDFGMSRDVYTCDYYKIGGSRMLPVRWMSPESILYGKFTLESDVWSFGVVLWEVFSLGVQPYYGHSNEQVVKLILQGILLTPPDLAPPIICQVLNGCWKTQPSDRLTFAEIHSKLKRCGSSTASTSSTPSSASRNVTYVDLCHDKQRAEYLQPLPDLPNHSYSNA